MDAHGTVSDDQDDFFKCILRGKVFSSRKKLFKHVKSLHPRISDSMQQEETSIRMKRMLVNPENSFSCGEEISTAADALPTESTVERETPNTVDETSSDAIDVLADDLIPSVDVPTDALLLSEQTAHISSNGVDSGYVTGGDGPVQSAATAEADVQSTAERNVEAEIAPVVVDARGVTDSVFPFTDDELASCGIDGDILLLRLPMTQCFVCPRPNCSMSFCTRLWTATKQSIIRYLREEHDAVFVDTHHWCGVCKQKIADLRPTNHPCLKSRSIFINENLVYLPHIRPKCKMSFLNRGLQNHRKVCNRHIQRQADNSQSASAQSDSPPPVLVSSRASIPEPTKQSPIAEPTITATDGTHDCALDILHEENSQHEEVEDINQVTDADLTQVDGPLLGFIPRFRAIAIDESEDRWEKFSALLEELSDFFRKFVKIPEYSGPAKKRRAQINPENHKDIQKLYKRNRRQAVRLILEETSRECNISFEELASTFAPTTTTDVDVERIFPHLHPPTNQLTYHLFCEVKLPLSGIKPKTLHPDQIV